MMRKLLEQWFKMKNKNEALYIKQRLSIIYAIVGWNMFGIVFYMLLKNKIPENSKDRSKSIGLFALLEISKNLYTSNEMNTTYVYRPSILSRLKLKV